MKKPVKVVIVGGNDLAIHAARALYKGINQGELEVTIIRRENYHVFHPLIAEMVTGRIAPEHILSPLRRIYKNVQIHVGEIDAIHLRSQMITITSSFDGRQYDIPYDHLVLSVKSVDHFSNYPGLAKHAFKLKTYDDCVQLKNHILKKFELAARIDDEEEQKKLLTFIVAGGGYGGTELAGELVDYIKILTSTEFKQLRYENCKVVLVQPGPHILPELYREKKGHPTLAEYAVNHLKRSSCFLYQGKMIPRSESFVPQSGELQSIRR